jgi:hypothetical protein
MSAIGLPKLISSHADYRREDYIFSRTQSRQQSNLQWKHRAGRLHAWSEWLLPAVSGLGLLLLSLMAFH